MSSAESHARFLMCRPDHFAVTYRINPWMDPQSWMRNDRALAAASMKEWLGLRDAMLDLGAAIEFVPSVPGMPDLVFTANGAVVLDGKVLLSHFRHPERQAEEPHFEAAFRGLQERAVVESVCRLPDDLVLEGAGDCVFDQTRNLFWMGYGQRSDLASRRAVEDVFGVDTVALELADPRFYHIDTALCALPRGEVMYVASAFAPKARADIRERVDLSNRIELAIDDGNRFAANAVALNDALLLAGCSDRLRGELEERGYKVMVVPLASFMRSGGSAFCLTLRLDRRSAVTGDARATGLDHALANRSAR